MLRMSFLLLATAIFCCGCSAKSNSKSAFKPATKGQAEEYSKKLPPAYQEANFSKLNQLIDWDELIRRATDVNGVSKKFKTGFAKGVRKSINTSLIKQITEAMKVGGRYDFLRVAMEDGNARAYFRMSLPNEGGVNYHIYDVEVNPEGQVRATDIYILLTGERLSKTLRRSLISASADQGIVAKLQGKENDFVKNIDKFGKMGSAVTNGKFRTVLNVYKTLPDSLKRDKNFLLLRYRAAAGLSDEEMLAAIDDFRQHHPSDPCAHFLSIDAFYSRNQPEKGLAAIDTVQEIIGTDAYLQSMRALFHVMAKDYDQATDFANKSIASDPTFDTPFNLLLTISLETQDHALTRQMLDKLQADFGYEFVDLTTVAEYAEFVKSDEYKAWVEK